jgi:hypothetical protein
MKAWLTFAAACALAALSLSASAQTQTLSCETLSPAATVNGRVVTFDVRYCGPLNANRFEYQALAAANGRLQAVWPSYQALEIAREQVSEMRGRLRSQGADPASLVRGCASESVGEEALMCGILMLVNERPHQATPYMEAAARSLPASQYGLWPGLTYVLAAPSEGDWTPYQRAAEASFTAAAGAGNRNAAAMIRIARG